jgi:hypothetical protein
MTVQWLVPWFAVESGEQRSTLETELRQEIARTHVLFGLKVSALGHRRDQDDVLFALEDGRVAEVHLTWRGTAETDPRWPEMVFFPSLTAWVEEQMVPAHADWVAWQGPHELPPPSDGWFLQDYAVNPNGHLLRMCATANVPGMLASWRNDGTSWPAGLGALIAAGTKTRIEVFSSSELIDALEFPFETLFPKFDRLSDGRWVVANARRWGKTNARILAPDGLLLSRLSLGDAIAHLQCDRMGGIWVGYFDEVSGEEPPGAYGVNRFRADGTIWWSPNTSLEPPIYDCYAMTVGADGVWLCYYGDFPIVHVAFDGALRQWPNDEIRGASIVAAGRDLAVLLGGYQVSGYPDESGTGALLRLGSDGRTDVLHRFELDLSMKAALNNGYAFARGPDVHFIDGNTWIVVTVQDFADGLARTPPRFPAYVAPPPEEPKPDGPGWTLKR